VSTWFQGLFHPPLGVLFTFPSRYWSTIGHTQVFSLGGWSPLLPTGFHVSRGTQDQYAVTRASPTGLSPSLMLLSNSFGSPLLGLVYCPTTPRWPKPPRFGLLPFRSPLLRESRLISLRRATEMFQFAHGPPLCLCVQHRVSRHHSGWVAPFGISRLIARMQLPLNVSPVSASFIG
jgi:hypothetical protein